MTRRIFKGVNETMSYSDVDELSEKMLTQLLSDIRDLIYEATDDEEDRASGLVHYSIMLGKYKNACELKGLLMDPDEYVAALQLPEGVVAYFEDEMEN